MKESVFQNEWKIAFNFLYPHGHFVKIPDQPRFGGERTHFAAPRPYDCYCIKDGKFIAFELKQQRSLSAFPFASVRDNQVDALQEVDRSGGRAYIVINYRTHKVPENRQKKYGLKSRFNYAFAISIIDFLKIKTEVYDDRCSIPFEDFLTCFNGFNVYQMEKRSIEGYPSPIWNISGLIEGCLE